VLDLPGFEARLDRQHYAAGPLADEPHHGALHARWPRASLGGGGEGQVFAFGAVALVAQRRHDFVIAEQHRDAPADLPRLALELEQQAQGARRAATAIE
jgi:hypothetical protein